LLFWISIPQQKRKYHPHFEGWKEERNIQSKFEGPYKIEESRQQSEGIC
jgi:hypothetical protein